MTPDSRSRGLGLALALLLAGCAGLPSQTPETVVETAPNAPAGGLRADERAPGTATPGTANPGAAPRGAASPGLAWLASTPVRGPTDATISILMFSDYQCPFCMRALTTVEQMLGRHADVQLVYLHRPLPFHPMARPAALAAAAANRQGMFWQMHDAMVAVGARISEPDLERIAGEIGLDVERWRLERDDPGVIAEVEQQGRIADMVNAHGTPTFFVNGERLVGAQSAEAFEAAIERARGRVADARARGLSGAALRVESWASDEPETSRRLLDHVVQGIPVTEADVAAKVPPKLKPRPQELPNEVWNVPVDVRLDPIAGDSARAELTWVVFSDLQCPFCRRMHQSMATLQQHYGDRLRVVWKSLPLPFHQHARDAQIAAYAAGRQGAYWPYVERCFGLHAAGVAQRVDDEALEQHAADLGLDLKRFARDRLDSKLAAQVDADMALAKQLGVRGTPTSFLNGRKVIGAQPIEVLRKHIDELLAASNGRRGHAAYEAAIRSGRNEADMP